MQQRRREVHRDRDGLPRARPAATLVERRFEDEKREALNQIGAFGVREEGIRRNQSAQRMLPAHERFHRDDGAGAQRDLRLIVDPQLVGFERLTQARLVGDRVVHLRGGRGRFRRFGGAGEHHVDGRDFARLVQVRGEGAAKLAEFDRLRDDVGHRQIERHAEARGAVQHTRFGRSRQDDGRGRAFGREQAQRFEALIPTAEREIHQDERGPRAAMDGADGRQIGADADVVALVFRNLANPPRDERVVIQDEQPIGTRDRTFWRTHVARTW